jgi:thiol-disulfide isomerase/thioredoxin
LYRLGRPHEARGLAHAVAKSETATEARRRKAQMLFRNPRCASEPCPEDLSFVTTDGRQHTLEDFEGKVVLLSFWATWCGPCVAAMPDLKRIHARHQKDPFVMVGVNMDHEPDLMERFIVEKKIPWAQTLDEGQRLRTQFGIKGIPAEIVIDHEGVLVGRSAGWSSGMGGALNDRIESALDRAKRAQPAAQAKIE